MISTTVVAGFRPQVRTCVRVRAKGLVCSRNSLRLNRGRTANLGVSVQAYPGDGFCFRNGRQMQSQMLSTESKSKDSRSGMITDETKLPMSDFAVAVASARNEKLREKHHKFITEYPDSAQPVDGLKVDPDFAHRKKLIYRSKQRGWLEVDLLMGSWAEDNVLSLTEDELQQYENIINLETLDIYNLVTKQMPVPDGLDGPVLKRLQEYALSSPAGIADPKKYSEIKKKMSN